MTVTIGMLVLVFAEKFIYYAVIRLLNPDTDKEAAVKKSLMLAALSLLADAVLAAAFCVVMKYTGGVFPGEKIIWLRFVITVELIHILFVYIGVFIEKRKRNPAFAPVNILLCLFPVSQLQVNLYLCEEPHFSNLIYGELSVLSGIVSAILLMYILYGMQERKSLEQNIKNHEAELALLYKSREQAASDEGELEILKAKYTKELDEIYNMIKRRSQKEDIANMLDELEEEILNTKGKNYCENVIVNEIIREKEQQCRQYNIDFDIDIKLPKDAEVSRLYWCSIFNNLLNNAINECIRLGDDQRRYIDLSCGIKGGYICIAVKNSSNRPTITFHKEKGLKEHGWGLKIMQDIASEYDGHFNTKYKNGEYQAVLMLGINSKQEGQQILENDGLLD